MNHEAQSGQAPTQGDIRIGISSWGSLPGFYPSGVKAAEKLSWYARFFTIVEVNVSFYRLVPPRTYDQWIAATPDGFCFDVKAFSELTHFQTAPLDDDFHRFRDSFRPLRQANRLGGVLFQFPPRFANNQASQDYLRRVSDEMAGEQVIVEFRNDSWLTAERAAATFTLLRELNIAYAIADEPQIPRDSVPPLLAVTDSNLAYVRFHGRNFEGWLRGGGGARYDFNYSDQLLKDWALNVKGLSEQAQHVHVFFNNNARGAGTLNAIRFGEMLGIAPANAPELPPAQQKLFDD